MAITGVNHAGAPLVKVVRLASFDIAVTKGVGFLPVADAFGANGAIDPAHRLARPDGDLRLRADQRHRRRLQQAQLQQAGLERARRCVCLRL